MCVCLCLCAWARVRVSVRVRFHGAVSAVHACAMIMVPVR